MSVYCLRFICAGQEESRLLQRKYQGQLHLDRAVQAPPALLVPQALQKAFHLPRLASSGQTPREVRRIGSGGTGEERRQAGRLCRSISSVRTQNRSSYFKSLFSCLSRSSGRAPYTVDLPLVCTWGLNLDIFADVSLQRAPASVISQ